MEANELARREGLRSEASRFQRGKMIIFRYHEIGRSRNGTVAELYGRHLCQGTPSCVTVPGAELFHQFRNASHQPLLMVFVEGFA